MEWPIIFTIFKKKALNRFQAGLTCLTINNVKPRLCPNSVPFCNSASVIYIWHHCGSIQAILIAPTTNLTYIKGVKIKNVIVKYITQHFTATSNMPNVNVKTSV